jgi:hypothetical protein
MEIVSVFLLTFYGHTMGRFFDPFDGGVKHQNSDGNTTKSGLIIVTSRRDVTGIMLSKGNRYTYQAITYYIILDPI